MVISWNAIGAGQPKTGKELPILWHGLRKTCGFPGSIAWKPGITSLVPTKIFCVPLQRLALSYLTDTAFSQTLIRYQHLIICIIGTLSGNEDWGQPWLREYSVRMAL
ncbi:MAG: hypothetical protein A2342_00740 [Gallionellales bacterium RIFOXYB12_FULL_54_9]|nr:MAG: hypothetical protein A2342_00740 [Gallionellales bacterium RIFOXYB12_FULL_54_9]